MQEKQKYTYNGGVMHFDRLVESNFRAVTYAVSRSKARSNIIYQFKKKAGLAQNTCVKLCDPIELA